MQQTTGLAVRPRYSHTIYIPSLYTVRQDLYTSQALAAATVAIYMLVVGVCALFWGPASDRYGRRPILLISTLLAVAFTLACYFAKTIGLLILFRGLQGAAGACREQQTTGLLIPFRGLQGAAVAAYGSTANGVLADTWPPHLRGTALGISTIPLLIGPLLGPVLGGGLAQAFGWRSTFLAVVVMAGGVILPLILLGVPETHHYWNLARLQRQDPAAAEGLKEAAAIRARPPRFQAPWYPYQILLDKYVILHATVTLVTFGSMFCSVTQLPVLLAQPPYGPTGHGMSPGTIGLACLSASAAGIIAAPIGGRIADFSAAVHGRNAHPLQRLMYNNALNLVLKPIGLLLYGWTAQYKLHVALPLVGMFLIGVSNNVYLPGIFSYVTNYRPQAAAAAAAGIHSVIINSVPNVVSTWS
ncbi:hypothetical protein OEZ85_011305 [Tetradesmus obliquus]|uniref:Major facilitator superfamily (MFS) profile domain-containing protein n=1 Tax=Tetradesmus obliquus TaxID=3088 RepID=A0ABY8TPX5_TETOB|nr:hypothetical protein OEZ85_011305 [Tetradesmus obliquus]